MLNLSAVRALVACALVCAALAYPAHAQKTKATLNSEINTNLPDNTIGQITAAGMRAVAADIRNSWRTSRLSMIRAVLFMICCPVTLKRKWSQV